MKIEMFNCYFGDCFCLGSEKKVYIDFGVHSGVSKVYADDSVEKIIDVILDDFHQNKIHDFLLTHYHTDHYSGLLKLIEKLKADPSIGSPIFSKFYLPDIWNFGDCTTISVCILEDILKNYKLSSRSYSIYELVKFLLTGVKDLVFVSRGTEMEFEDKCQALWPRMDKVNISAKRLVKSFETIKIIDDKFIKDLNDISKRLREILLNYRNESPDALREIIRLTEEFILNHMEQLEKLEDMLELSKDNEDITCLNEFGNSISIVFQNQKCGNRNYLFTGDITKGCMSFIKRNKEYPIHDKFYYIKIPHHGTENTYYNFVCYEPKIVMIPNGECNTDSYKISTKYVNDFGKTAKVYCSNCNWCAGKIGVHIKDCTCSTNEIIFSELSKVVI